MNRRQARVGTPLMDTRMQFAFSYKVMHQALKERRGLDNEDQGRLRLEPQLLDARRDAPCAAAQSGAINLDHFPRDRILVYHCQWSDHVPASFLGM